MNTSSMYTNSKITGSTYSGSMYTNSKITGSTYTNSKNTGSMNTRSSNTGSRNTGSMNSGSMNMNEKTLRMIVKTAFILLIALFFIPCITISCGSEQFPHSMMDIACGGSKKLRDLAGHSEDMKGNLIYLVMLLLPLIGVVLQFLPKTELNLDSKSQGVLSAILFGINMAIWIFVYAGIKNKTVTGDYAGWITVSATPAYWFSLVIHAAGLASAAGCVLLASEESPSSRRSYASGDRFSPAKRQAAGEWLSSVILQPVGSLLSSVKQTSSANMVPSSAAAAVHDRRITDTRGTRFGFNRPAGPSHNRQTEPPYGRPAVSSPVRMRMSASEPQKTWICGECGGQMRAGANFCFQCGAKKPEMRPAGYCSACGGMNAAGSRFCGHCGSAL